MPVQITWACSSVWCAFSKSADPIAAAEYMQKEADIREALGDRAFAENPNVRIVLDLGWIISTTRLDETLKNIASTHPHEHSLAESLIRNYWPAIVHLNTDDQQRWVTGSWLLALAHPKARASRSTALPGSSKGTPNQHLCTVCRVRTQPSRATAHCATMIKTSAVLPLSQGPGQEHRFGADV